MGSFDSDFYKKDWDFTLCGERFSLWSGKCSAVLVWMFPSYFLLTLVSAVYMGKHRGERVPFAICHKSFNVRVKMILTVILLLGPVVGLLISYFLNVTIFIIDYLSTFLQSFCWLIHLGYLSSLPLPASKGHYFINILYLLSLSICGHNLYVTLHNVVSNITAQYTVIICCSVQALYLLTCIPKKCLYCIFPEPLVLTNLSNSLTNLVSSSAMENHDSERSNPYVLGIAEESGILSKLFFCWVHPLMSKGFYHLIKTSEDLFELPLSLQAIHINSKVQSVIGNCMPSSADCSIANTLSSADSPLVSILPTTDSPFASTSSTIDTTFANPSLSFPNLLFVFRRCFGFEYCIIGILKFFSDCLAFSGPILLNLLVSFLEDNRKSYIGFLYALALFVVTLINALLTTHYSYLVNRIGLKVKSALISTIYEKTLNINKSTLSSFNTGEIVDFMSTDTDRVVNFCPSFHQFWSLPFQIAITLYLLYIQIGFSFLIGLVFVLVIVPVNHLIAKKIGTYSKLMMEQKDMRIKLMSEALSGMKVIKMQAWETAFSKKIKDIREREINYLKKRKYLDALCVYFWATTPVIVSFLSFTTYVLMGNTLTASRIFTSIALFNLLIVPLNAFPWVLNGLVEAFISAKRIEALLKLPELQLDHYYSSLQNDCTELEIRNGSFCNSVKFVNSEKLFPNEINWKEFQLGPLNVSILKGKFICVVGKVGSGKSTFLSAILADIPRLTGSVHISILDWKKGFGLVTQEPWIMQASIRENVLFGKLMDYSKYRMILEACALSHDLKMLPSGDLTEVGEKGMTLSGGQKARIALARAVYQDLDLYLLDDPLAAVDVHVSEHLLTECILGLLQNKTRIMCTHRMNIAKKADVIIFLEDGIISMQGPPSFLCQHEAVILCEEKSEDKEDLRTDLPENDGELSVKNLDNSIVTQDEEKDSGKLKFQVYLGYWNAIGSKLVALVFFSCFIMQASKTVSDWWLSFWIHSSENSQNISQINDTGFILQDKIFKNASGLLDEKVTYYLSVYGGIAVANTIFTFLRAFTFAYCGISAAIMLQNKLKDCIFKAPFSFFCVTPIGRILNRFSSDVYNIDDSLPFMLNIFLAQLFALCGCLVVTCYSLPFIILLLIPLAVGYYYIQHYYRQTSRELKRISSVTLSPIYAHFSETLDGQSTIRSLRVSSRFKKKNMEKVDSFQKACFAITAVSQWLNLQLQLIGVLVVSGVALIALLENSFNSVDPGLVGLALSYALTLTGLLNGVVTSFTETEKELVSVERVMQYINNVPHETDESTLMSSSTWPSEGVIEFKNVYMQYKRDALCALENISFKTRPAEKLGIVGRTGSGKSSLIQALFRIVDINSGQILIDDTEISSIQLHELRSQLSVVPQDPFLFSGSIKENLDPNNIYNDGDIFRALDKCCMLEKICNLSGLESKVEEGGKNFSAGERQLISLARALLHKAKILCLDEATANIDHKTDGLLQQTIRKVFRCSTIIIIAHRIETVMDCDRVMVIKNGQILELDEPSLLLRDSSSEFYKLVYGLQ